jgi:hypothetical protein
MVEADEVENRSTDALLSPNRKEKRDLTYDSIDKQAEKKSGEIPSLEM